jgi:hypothetical protein
MSCLSSDNLKERKELLSHLSWSHSGQKDIWSTLLTFGGSSLQRSGFRSAGSDIILQV